MGEHQDKINELIRRWLISLNDYPGWKEYQKRRTSFTINFDEPYIKCEPPGDFHFSEETSKQHKVVYGYLKLQSTLNCLKDVEFYFRRFPFRGLPISKHDHMVNVCEMYFNRFYEFSERLKLYFDDLKAAKNPGVELNFGRFIKAFKREFDQELRERNRVHHDSRFEDLALDRVFLYGTLGFFKNQSLKSEESYYYRKVSKEWAKRVRARSAVAEQFLDAVAHATIESCDFLKSVQNDNNNLDII